MATSLLCVIFAPCVTQTPPLIKGWYIPHDSKCKLHLVASCVIQGFLPLITPFLYSLKTAFLI
jgi:hypothetical protein